ncbi:ABC transporter substrate-binding protein [Actinomycetospora sp. NBC_00405]|uniref:ABC transporter substrate-binding protein n=1 Tax=Actinomycetospora sp. NBC_00405 TaxID=2975952 RepID=UPI002E2378C7
MPSRVRTLAAAGAAALTVAVLTSCAGGPPAAPAPPPEAGAGVENCGRPVPVGAPPQRIFAAFQNGIEMVHALDAGDRLVGTAYLDNPILAEFAADQARPAYFPEEYPSREEVLRLDPDFVVSGFTGGFTTEGLGTRTELASIGIGSYLFTPYCPPADGGAQADVVAAPVPFDEVYTDITDLGRILGRPDLATQRVDAMRTEIAQVQGAVAPLPRPRVAVLNRLASGGAGLRVFGADDIATTIVEAAGGQQAFGDVSGRQTQVGAEEIVRRNPDVILVPACCSADTGPEGAQPVIDGLLADPALASVPAVRDGRIAGITFAEISPGVRNADAVANVARILHPGAQGL